MDGYYDAARKLKLYIEGEKKNVPDQLDRSSFEKIVVDLRMRERIVFSLLIQREQVRTVFLDFINSIKFSGDSNFKKDSLIRFYDYLLLPFKYYNYYAGLVGIALL